MIHCVDYHLQFDLESINHVFASTTTVAIFIIISQSWGNGQDSDHHYHHWHDYHDDSITVTHTSH